MLFRSQAATQAAQSAGSAQAAAQSAQTQARSAAAAAQGAQEAVNGCVRVVKSGSVSIPATGWTQDARGNYRASAAISGLTPESRLRWGLAPESVGAAMILGAICETAGSLTVIALTEPTEAFTLQYSMEEIIAG